MRVMRIRNGMRCAVALLLLCLLLPAPWEGLTETTSAAGSAPKALLVMAFAPGENLRSTSVPDLQSTVQTLWKYGFEVYILDAYEEGGSLSPCPHYQLHRHVSDRRYNLVVYYGHGNDERWGFCLPQDMAWASRTDTLEGRDEAREFGDFRTHWREEIRLAPNAMVVMRHTCFANGLQAADMGSGAALPSKEEVLRRLNEYSYTFLQEGPGARSFTASINVGSTPSYLESLFREHHRAIGELTVPDLSASYAAGSGYEFLQGRHQRLGSEGVVYRKNRFPGSGNGAVWGQPGWAGDPLLTAEGVCGMVPGDKNTDGDNTDLGEPCFPHDKRDTFPGEDASYNFFPFLSIANPSSMSTWAEITFRDEAGEYLKIYREVEAASRITLDLNANPHLRDKNLAVEVRSVDGAPLLAERPMYFRYHGWMDGGSVAFGRTEAHTSWYFAEGYASDSQPFHEYICVANFGTGTARGVLELLPERGEPTEVELEVPPGTRRTYHVNAYTQGAVSARVETDLPVAAERSMYFLYLSPDGAFIADGGHGKPGVNSLSREWYFAEGRVGDDFDAWVLLANPGTGAASAGVTCYTPRGERVRRDIVLPPGSRRTLRIDDLFPSASDVSVRVSSDVPIACERAMYFRYNGAWEDGHVSPGVTEPSRRWMFAEGSAFDGIHQYVPVLNPDDEAAVIEARFLLGPGEGTRTQTYRVGPHARMTIDVNAALAAEGEPSQVALDITSNLPVVVERAMYFDLGRGAGGREPIRGGHVSAGVSSPASAWLFAEAYTGR